MSVFRSLKGTFQNVQQDIVDGFRALTSLDSSPRHEKVKQLRVDGKSLDCGADLLYRYQREWSELHNYTADTAKKAEEVDGAVTDLFSRYTTRWEATSQLEEEVSTLPAFVSSVDDMIQLIDSLQTDFQRLEAELEKLENLCEEEEMERRKMSHMKQLSAYKKAKNAEAFSVKAKLWNLLKERSKEVEIRKSHAMKERQEAFLDAFTSDMEYYRKHGHTDKLPSVTDFPKVSSLSEISIDDDKKALDEFLSSPDGEHGGGLFIEDDYTTDYNGAEEPSEDIPELDENRPINFDDDSQKIVRAAPDQDSCTDFEEESLSTTAETADTQQQEAEITHAHQGKTAESTVGSDGMHEKTDGDVSEVKKAEEGTAEFSADT
ncbi:dysbindin-A-like [Babylonia areolata]|uniref:dysbindin-A-like n=1 Tax=Babylonia areolata TaxID=304850 RepID=UPI003FD674A0